MIKTLEVMRTNKEGIYQAVEILKEHYRDELAWIARAIEDAEGERAFLLAQRKKIEDLVIELSACLKG